MKYTTITKIGPYLSGIYDDCHTYIQSNGDRFRVITEGVTWDGNSGSFDRANHYLSRDIGKQLVRDIRLARINNAHGNFNQTDLSVVQNCLATHSD